MSTQEQVLKKFDKCANYTVLSMLVMNTLVSMRRFENVPHDELVTKIYTSLKSKAGSRAAIVNRSNAV